VEHWDGTSWSIVPSPNIGTSYNELYGVAAVSANDIWAVGKYTEYSSGAYYILVEHWDGANWMVVPASDVGLNYSWFYGVAATSTSDVWAVGWADTSGSSPTQTLVEHWDGTSWRIVPSPNIGTSNNILFGVTAISAADVWAVGHSSSAQTLVEHWDGTSWSIVPSPNPNMGYITLYGVTAASINDVWAVGVINNAQTLVEHWDGTSWHIVPSPNLNANTNQLYSVAAHAGDVWAVGVAENEPSTDTSRTLIEHYISTCP
jgi:hypothetical protein